MTYFEFPGEKLFPRRSHFRGEAIFGEKPFSGRSHFGGEAVFREMPFFKKNLLPLPCKECSKSFSESGSLKGDTYLIVTQVFPHAHISGHALEVSGERMWPYYELVEGI